MDQNVNFVPKSSNPPNIPQARPIENFWGCFGQKVYEKGWQAKSHDQLVSRIESKLKVFDLNYWVYVTLVPTLTYQISTYQISTYRNSTYQNNTYQIRTYQN